MTTIRDLAGGALALQREIDQLTRPAADPLRVLALDCATVTGWATNCAGGVESGIQKFELRRGESTGMRYLRFRNWLKELLATLQPDVVVYERPIGRNQLSQAAAELAHALCSRVAEECDVAQVDYCSVDPNVLKRHATGRGNADKDAMIAAAKTRFGMVGDLNNNAADALLLLAFALDGFPEPAPSRRRKTTKAKA